MSLESDIARLSDDERLIVEALVDKLLSEGRDEYGPLDLSTDTRTIEELIDDWLDEFVDSGFYAFMIALKLKRLGKN